MRRRKSKGVGAGQRKLICGLYVQFISLKLSCGVAEGRVLATTAR
jgi:hypothetical protein